MESNQDTVNLLRTLSETTGLSGNEQPIRDFVTGWLNEYADQVKVDALGNLLALKRGQAQATNQPQRRVMLAAHMDEIGLIVKAIDREFIRLSTIGGIDARVLPSQEVVVHGRRQLQGVIGARPPHVTSQGERQEGLKIDDLFVDVGLSETTLREAVRVGDVISFQRSVTSLAGNNVSGKALDDRAGIAVMLLTVRNLAGMSHAWDFFGVATVQEELGLYGAETSAFGLYPDIGIAVDVTHAAMPGLDPAETSTLGRGPVIAWGPNFHAKIHERLVNTAKKLEIPYQIQAEPGGSGTDAFAIQVAKGGVPTGLVSIPLRYMHTTVETVETTDIDRAARLLAAFVSSLSDDFLAELIPSF